MPKPSADTLCLLSNPYAQIREVVLSAFICMPHMYASYVCLICMPHMYA